jgi:hypothetical protein
LLALFLLVLLSPSPRASGPAFVQSNIGGSATSPVSCAYPSNIGHGDLLITHGFVNGSVTDATGIVDSPGANIWNKYQNANQTTNVWVDMWSAVAAATTADTVTLSNSGSVSSFLCINAEYSGLTNWTLDQQIAVVTPPTASATITTTHAVELLVGFVQCAAGGGTLTGTPTFTVRQNDSGFSIYADATVSSIGTYTVTASCLGLGGGSAGIASFYSPSSVRHHVEQY